MVHSNQKDRELVTKRSQLSIPDSYESSRQRFRGTLNQIRAHWPRAETAKHDLSCAPGLSIDWITADSTAQKERLFILTTGEHGIEGYIGAVMMQLFILEYIPLFNPKTSGVLLMHAINPWGMKHDRCANKNNVDLNRNFNIDFSSLLKSNRDYSQLYTFFNPGTTINSLLISRLKFLFQMPKQIRDFGVRRIREAALMGQYDYPDGILYGGNSLQEESKILIELFDRHINGYAQVLHLDMHTGYGPRYQMTLLNSSREKMSAEETQRRFKVPRAAGINPDEFYTIHGDMTDYLYDHIRKNHPGIDFYAAAFEFGTYGDSLLAGIRSLLVTVLENQLSNHGADPKARARIKQAYKELYRPSSKRWLRTATANAQTAFQGIFREQAFF